MQPVIKVPLRYGVIAGLVGFGLLVGLYYMGRHPLLIPVFLDFRIILFGVFIFFTLREIRDYYQNGILYFWQGIIASLLFTACYAFIASLALYLFVLAAPVFLSDYVNLSIQQLKSLPSQVIEQIGREVYERNLGLLPATSASDLGLLYFLQSFMISLFISIILSVTLRRQPKS